MNYSHIQFIPEKFDKIKFRSSSLGRLKKGMWVRVKYKETYQYGIFQKLEDNYLWGYWNREFKGRDLFEQKNKQSLYPEQQMADMRFIPNIEVLCRKSKPVTYGEMLERIGK
jgi:hypothetical protein